MWPAKAHQHCWRLHPPAMGGGGGDPARSDPDATPWPNLGGNTTVSLPQASVRSCEPTWRPLPRMGKGCRRLHPYAMGGCGGVPARPGAGATPRWILGGDSEVTPPQASVCPEHPSRRPPPRWGGGPPRLGKGALRRIDARRRHRACAEPAERRWAGRGGGGASRASSHGRCHPPPSCTPTRGPPRRVRTQGSSPRQTSACLRCALLPGLLGPCHGGRLRPAGHHHRPTPSRAPTLGPPPRARTQGTRPRQTSACLRLALPQAVLWPRLRTPGPGSSGRLRTAVHHHRPAPPARESAGWPITPVHSIHEPRRGKYPKRYVGGWGGLGRAVRQ